jgi:hypothetical protein
MITSYYCSVALFSRIQAAATTASHRIGIRPGVCNLAGRRRRNQEDAVEETLAIVGGIGGTQSKRRWRPAQMMGPRHHRNRVRSRGHRATRETPLLFTLSNSHGFFLIILVPFLFTSQH